MFYINLGGYIMQSNLLEEVSNNEIQLEFEQMNNKFLGAYYHVDGVDIILLNEMLLNNKKLLNCVLAEELGHFYTTVISELPISKNQKYDNNLNYEKSENMALKWATNFMIPDEKLIKCINDNQEVNMYEISNIFNVTKGFVELKFYHMSLVKSSYKLNCGAYLILSNFPNVYIYEDFNRSDIYGYNYKTR